MVEDIDKELIKVKQGTREGARKWPRKMLMDVLVEVATFSSLAGKGRGSNWSVVTNTLVSVYRDEVAKKRVIDDYNSMPPPTSHSGPMLTEKK